MTIVRKQISGQTYIYEVKKGKWYYLGKEKPIEELVGKVHCSDAFKLLPLMPSKSVDFIMFSPPYWGLRDYSIEGQIGLEPTYQEYIAKLVRLCRELKRILKKRGSLYIVLGDTYSGGSSHSMDGKWKALRANRKPMDSARPQRSLSHPPPKCLMGIPWRIALALIDDGWILRNDIIWHKPNAMPSSVKDRLTNTYEHIFHFVKARRYYYDLDAVRESHHTKRWGRNPKYEKLHSGLETQGYHPKGKNPGDVFTTHNIESLKAYCLKKYEERVKERLAYRHKQGKGIPPSFKSISEWNRGTRETMNKIINSLDVPESIKSRLRSWWHDRQGHPKGKNPGDFWSIPTKPFKEAHFAVYPEEICVKPIKSSCPPDGIVLDPMCGSGTTLVVAKKLGRRIIGIDINPEYVNMARKRLKPYLQASKA